MSKESVEKCNVQGITFSFLGKGSFSNAFVTTLDRDVTINGAKFPRGQKVVYKVLREDEESFLRFVQACQSRSAELDLASQKKGVLTDDESMALTAAWVQHVKAIVQSMLDSNDRLIRLWNTYNSNLEFPAQAFGNGYIVPYVEGELPSYEEIADFCLEFFTKHQRIILDPQVQDNFRRIKTAQIVPIDFGRFLLLTVEKEVLLNSSASLNYADLFLNAMNIDFKKAIEADPTGSFIFNVTKSLLFLQENFPTVKNVLALKDNYDVMNTLAAYYDAVKDEAALARKENRKARCFHFNEVRAFFKLPQFSNSDESFLNLPVTPIEKSPFLLRATQRQKERYKALIKMEREINSPETTPQQLNDFTDALLERGDEDSRTVRLKRNVLIALIANDKTAAPALEKLMVMVQASDPWILKRIEKNPNMTKKLRQDLEEKKKFLAIKHDVVKKIEGYLQNRFGDCVKRAQFSPRLFWNRAFIAALEKLIEALEAATNEEIFLEILVAARDVDVLKEVRAFLSECGEMFFFRINRRIEEANDSKRADINSVL